MTVGGMGFIPERLLMMMMMMIQNWSATLYNTCSSSSSHTSFLVCHPWLPIYHVFYSLGPGRFAHKDLAWDYTDLQQRSTHAAVALPSLSFVALASWAATALACSSAFTVAGTLVQAFTPPFLASRCTVILVAPPGNSSSQYTHLHLGYLHLRFQALAYLEFLHAATQCHLSWEPACSTQTRHFRPYFSGGEYPTQLPAQLLKIIII